MKLLCIADTHGQLRDDWYNGEEYDLCVMLGDHSIGDAEKILRYIPKEKIRAIYGNHDAPVLGRTPITYFGLTELKYEVFNGVRLLRVLRSRTLNTDAEQTSFARSQVPAVAGKAKSVNPDRYDYNLFGDVASL